MILTCPSCQTKYVVKDGAIPSQGRQVRCANCKESWHQLPEGELPAASMPDPPATVGEASPPSSDGTVTVATGELKSASYADFGRDVMASEAAGIAAEPVPDMNQPAEAGGEPEDAVVAQEIGGGPPEPVVEAEDAAIAATSDEATIEPVDEIGPLEEVRTATEEDFAVHIPDEDETPRGKGPLMLLVALLLAIAAAAAWFLAPATLKNRLGIAGADKSPLELMVTTSDRQQLASGNELLAISGRVINPTGEEQSVPPIRAELRNKVSQKVVYQWTIAPPARSLPPGGSATFNSAEVDIPPGGDELTVTLANAAG